MIGLKVAVPVACFRKGFAREFWETEELPPPATCYGFLLSLVGETDRRRHIGARVAPGLFPQYALNGRPTSPDRSAVLRTLWRVKRNELGASGNTRPDFQELLTGVHLAIWLDSTEEVGSGSSLEDRVVTALDHPEQIDRFGGLSLGESTHLVDEVRRLRPDDLGPARTYLLAERGRLSLPVWVDHVGSSGTRYACGDLEEWDSAVNPPSDRMPLIAPPLTMTSA
jgi:CRISPR-associated protein Cas5t